jgi:hypothetical protein
MDNRQDSDQRGDGVHGVIVIRPRGDWKIARVGQCRLPEGRVSLCRNPWHEKSTLETT